MTPLGTGTTDRIIHSPVFRVVTTCKTCSEEETAYCSTLFGYVPKRWLSFDWSRRAFSGVAHRFDSFRRADRLLLEDEIGYSVVPKEVG